MTYAAQRVELISVTQRTAPLTGSWRGASGDGVTDDTASIQAALDAAHAIYEATGSRAEVFLPPGTYLVSRAGNAYHCLSIASGVYFHGPGRLVQASSQVPQVRVIAIENAEDVIVDGLTIDGNATGQDPGEDEPQHHGFFVRGSRNVILRNIVGTQIDGDLFYFGKAEHTQRIASDCLVENFRADGTRRSVVTVTAGASYITVRDGYCINWSETISNALNIESDGESESIGCVFDRIHVERSAGDPNRRSFAVSVAQGHATTITGCRLSAAVKVDNSNDVTISDNIIDHPGTTTAGGSGIQAGYDCSRLTIQRNTITVLGPATNSTAKNHKACIYVAQFEGQAPSDVFIQHNRLFPGAGLSGIVCESLSGTTTIDANLIDGRREGRGIVIHLVSSAMPFPDVAITHNTIRNVVGTPRAGAVNDGGAIYLLNGNATLKFERIQVVGNRFVAAQPDPTLTCAVAVGQSNTMGQAAYGDLAISMNMIIPLIAQDVAGLVWWRTSGNAGNGNGASAGFEGSGSPENRIPAAVGSTYRRRDGSAGTSFYVKESGAGANGWVPK